MWGKLCRRGVESATATIEHRFESRQGFRGFVRCYTVICNIVCVVSVSAYLMEAWSHIRLSNRRGLVLESRQHTYRII
jgi:hypothetical protein